MKRILCIAGSCCDLVFGGLDRLPSLGEEIFGTQFSMQAGGGANTAVQLGRLGADVSFWTLLGPDLAGDIVRDALVKANVRLIEHGQIIGRTPVSAVLSTKEDRAFASFDAGDPLIENVAALETAIVKADIVHTFLGYCLSYPIAELSRKHNKILSVDCSFCDAPGEQTDAILRECDYWKGNEGEALRLTGAADVETALLHLAGIVRRGAVVTLGGEGSLGTERGRTPVFVPAAPVERFVDACGAGDAYAAGFLFGLADDEPFAACMARGAALAASVVQHYGGTPEQERFCN